MSRFGTSSQSKGSPSLSWTLELLGISIQILFGLFMGLWRHRIIRRHFGSMSRKVHLLCAERTEAKSPGTGRKSARGTRSQGKHVNHDIGIAELIHGEIEDAIESDTEESDGQDIILLC